MYEGDWDEVVVTKNPRLKEIDVSFQNISKIGGSESANIDIGGGGGTDDGGGSGTDNGDTGGNGGDGGGEAYCPGPECQASSCTSYFEDLEAGIINGDIAVTVGTVSSISSTVEGSPTYSVAGEGGALFVTNAAGGPSNVPAFNLGASAQLGTYNCRAGGLCAEVPGQKIIRPINSTSTGSFLKLGTTIDGVTKDLNTEVFPETPDFSYSFYIDFCGDVLFYWQPLGLYNYWRSAGRLGPSAFNLTNRIDIDTTTGTITIPVVGDSTYVLNLTPGYQNFRGWYTYSTTRKAEANGNNFIFTAEHNFSGPNGFAFSYTKTSEDSGPLYGFIPGNVYGQQKGFSYWSAGDTSNAPIVAVSIDVVSARERSQFNRLFEHYTSPDYCQRIP